MSWAARRRLLYGGTAVVIMALFTGLFFYKLFYRAPTCSDGFKNGDETGIDCGGSCRNICTSDSLKPVVLWTKIFNISGDVYTAVSLADNPNINSKNLGAKYRFNIYDENNKLILSKEGVTTIPKGKKFSIFENGIVIKNSKPKTAEIEFLSFSPWVKDTTQAPEITIKYSPLVGTSSVPKINGTISNDSLQNIPEVELSVFVLDGNENVVAASRSFVENLGKKSQQDFVFTWPKPFNLGVEACTSPLSIALLLDRSGSMRSEGLFPPEPFTTVTKTAESFVKNLTSNDDISIISFGNTSKIESGLTKDKALAIKTVASLSLSTTTQENTNISSALNDAVTELSSLDNETKKVIILLTDGIPTLPVDTNNPDFPAISAQQVAKSIQDSKIDLFTIGLGKNVSEGFLKSISTSDSYYYYAPTKEKLSDIYSQISSKLCQKKPNVIDVVYKIVDKN